MHFEEYQRRSRKTAIYPNKGNNFIYPILGLSGEAGEVAEKIKKVIRDNGGRIDEHMREQIKKELGDVLWYISQLASELHVALDDIATVNLTKLYSRHARGVLRGSGDDR